MKKKILAITCLTAALALTALVGCGGGNGGGGDASSSSSTVAPGMDSSLYNNSEIVVGGNTNSGAVDTQEIIISGVTDWHIPASQTSLANEIAQVTAMKGEAVQTVQANTSAVKFGQKGTYTVSFTAGNATETCTVTVYDAPIAGAHNGDAITLAYSQIYTSLTEGVEFTDCFGTKLEVAVINDGGIKNADGSLNLGTFTVKYMATDKAGQSLYATRQVTVTEEKNPTIVGQTYDMADDQLVINVDSEDFNNFLSIALDGVAVSEEYYSKSNNTIYIDGNYIFDRFGRTGEVSLRYLSAKGYADTTLTLTDKKTVAIDDSAIEEFALTYFATFTPHKIPSIVLTNHRQSEIPVYQVFKDGVEVELTEQSMTLMQDGDFTLQVTVRDKVYTYPLTAFYDLGFRDGLSITQDAEDKLSGRFLSEFTYLELRVRSKDGSKTYALYKKDSENFGDINAFETLVKSLNKKSGYSLLIRAQKDGKLYTQTVDMLVTAADATNILTTQDSYQNGNIAPYNSKATLSYAMKSVSGRRGTFLWESNGASLSGATLRPSAAMCSVLQAGTYLTFDLYYEGNSLPALYLNGKTITAAAKAQYNFNGGSGVIYMWNGQIPSDKAIVDDKGTEDPSDDETSILEAAVKVYNANGERVYTHQAGAWYTYEVKLPWAMEYKEYNGIMMYQRAAGANVYIANIKASTTSFMNDATVNKEVAAEMEQEDKVVWNPDLWDDQTGLY